MATPEKELTMEDLFERAEREGLWFYTSYQQIWFSPRELKEQRAIGRFMWGAPNWQLRNPQEYLQAAQRELEEAQRHFEGVKANIEREQRAAAGEASPEARTSQSEESHSPLADSKNVTFNYLARAYSAEGEERWRKKSAKQRRF